MGKTPLRPRWAWLVDLLDGREFKHIVANLYFTNKILGLFSLCMRLDWIGGRPFTSFVNPARLIKSDHYWWTLINFGGHVGHRTGQTIAQYLGSSWEIQYCARVVGLPYNIIAAIEMLILAVL